MAHIVAVSEKGINAFENMIVLCSNCHISYDYGKGQLKSPTSESMYRLKDNLKIINGRYSPFELRILYHFIDSKEGKSR